MKKLLLLLPFLFSNALAGECITYSSMDRFDAKSSTALTIYTSGTNDYNMTVSVCFDLLTANRIGFDSFSSFQVCENDYLLIIDEFSGGIKSRCWITSITKQ